MKIKNIWLAGGLLLLAACNESEYDLENLVPAEYHKILYVNNSGKQELTLFDTEEDNTYSFSVFKAGSDPYQTASVDVNVLSQEEVDSEYSQLEGVSYKVLSTDCYSLGTTHLDFSVDDRYKLVDIALKPQQVKALMATDPESVWVLPLHVTSESDSINANKDELFLQIMDVIMPALGFTSTSVTVDQYNYGSAPDLNKNIGIGLDTDNKWDITGQLVVDEAYIAEYNEENGTVYQMLPEGTYTVPESVTLAAGITNSSISVAVSASALEPGDYMLPIRIESVSQFSISSSNAVYLLAIRIMAPELDRTGWTAEANTEELVGELPSGKADCALDGDLGTYWHSMWNSGVNPGMPYEIIVDTKSEHTFSQFALVQRQHDSYMDTAYGKFYVSSDKEEWTEVGSFSMQQVMTAQTFGVIPTEGRYFKVVIEASYRGNNASLSEIYAYGF